MSKSLCGDPTCQSYGCTQEAIDAWHAREQADARVVVRQALGLPPEPDPNIIEARRIDGSGDTAP